jgi:2-polyprenyl-6-methoxyphenol hydroxylase-like FAD-dependent oxidoreductase
MAHKASGMINATLTKSHDVVVVGGSQAGLAVGYFLAQQGRDFPILEAASQRQRIP